MCEIFTDKQNPNIPSIFSSKIKYGEKGNNNKYNILYCTINLINGKFYIGILSTKKYYITHDYLGSGTYLHKSINKYGKHNFYRLDLEFYNTEEQAFDREAEIVNEEFLIKYRDNCYNIALGGNFKYNKHGYSVINNSPNAREIHKRAEKTFQKNYYSEENKEYRRFLRNKRKEYCNTKEYKNKCKQQFENWWANLSDEQYATYCQNAKDRYENMTEEEYKEHCNRSKEYFKNLTEEEYKEHCNKIKLGWENMDEDKYKEVQLKASLHSKNTIWIKKDNICKMIKPEELQQYLDDGWMRGRIVKRIKPCFYKNKTEEEKLEFRQKCSLNCKNRQWINKNNESKMIKPEELQQYLDNGWKEGRGKLKVKF